MILNIVVILIVGLVAYLHFVQGLLTGLISAVLAAIAAALAIGHYESLAASLSGGKYNDQAQSICLIAIFALVYLVGRVLFDKFVPGNVRIPFLLDKIGGTACGLVAGVLGAGIVTLAIQAMPFGPAVAGHARYDLNREPKSVVVMASGGGSPVDRTVHDELKEESLQHAPGRLILPVDDLTVGFVYLLSGGGSLAGDTDLASVHPNLLDEYFFQRLGVQTGGRHTASNKNSSQVTVPKAYVLPPKLPQRVAEVKQIRDPKAGTFDPGLNKRAVAITVQFLQAAADEKDNKVRLSPGSIRLVTPTADGGFVNNYPVGTVQEGVVWLNNRDDFLIIDVAKEDGGAHFVFAVDESALVASAPAPRAAGATTGPVDPAAAALARRYTFAPGTFIEVKRDVRVPLDDGSMTLATALPPDSIRTTPMRKTELYKPPAPPAPGTATPPTTPAGARAPRQATDANGWTRSPLKGPPRVKASADLPVEIGGLVDGEPDVTTSVVMGHLTARKFDQLEVTMTDDSATPEKLSAGAVKTAALHVPADRRAVQVTLTAATPGAPANWDFLKTPEAFTVVDAAGASHKPRGVFLASNDSPKKVFAAYNANADLTAAALTKIPKVDTATLGDVTLIFLLPTAQKAVELRYTNLPEGFWLEE